MGQDDSAPLSATVTDMQITPTRSIFTMHAGLMNLTITFLSPIEVMTGICCQSYPITHLKLSRRTGSYNLYHFPTSPWMQAPSTGRLTMYSFIRTSLPVGHLTDHLCTVIADGHPFTACLDWVTGDRVRDVQWSQHATAGSIYHQVSLIDPQPGEENNQQAQDGVAYYGMANVRPPRSHDHITSLTYMIQRQGLTWTVDNSVIARAQFRNLGKLANNASTAYGPMQQ